MYKGEAKIFSSLHAYCDSEKTDIAWEVTINGEEERAVVTEAFSFSPAFAKTVSVQ